MKLARILVVDDNPINLRLISALLAFEGYEVIMAMNAEDAQIDLADTLPDLILMNIALPGMDPVPVRRRLGLVFQAFNLFPHRSVLENVILGAVHAQKLPRAQAREAGMATLARFGLADRCDDYPDRLSGGQQQRVAIARALVARPRALLLDEVTSALDPELVGEVLKVIRDLKADGMTMIIATHEMSFAREVADQVCFLEEGRIIERGSPDRMFSAPERSETQRFLARLLSANRL